MNTNIALSCLFYLLTESALDRDTDRDSSNSDSESKQIQGTLLKIDFFFVIVLRLLFMRTKYEWETTHINTFKVKG